MDEMNNLYILKDYGRVKVKLAEILDSKKIARNRLSLLADVDYSVINWYYSGDIQRVDLEVLAKVCFVLNCQISDFLEYEPEESKK